MHVCEGCMLGKNIENPFQKGETWRTKTVLELMHADLCGPMRTPSKSQNRYFILFIDDFSRMTWLYFLKEISEVFEIFKKFKLLVVNFSGRKLRTLRKSLMIFVKMRGWNMS